jgi:hypothetical protein
MTKQKTMTKNQPQKEQTGMQSGTPSRIQKTRKLAFLNLEPAPGFKKNNNHFWSFLIGWLVF